MQQCENRLGCTGGSRYGSPTVECKLYGYFNGGRDHDGICKSSGGNDYSDILQCNTVRPALCGGSSSRDYRTFEGVCHICEAGKYKTADADTVCDTCPANTNSLPGSDLASDCVCNQGFAADASDATLCHQCEAGKFNDRPRASSVSPVVQYLQMLRTIRRAPAYAAHPPGTKSTPTATTCSCALPTRIKTETVRRVWHARKSTRVHRARRRAPRRTTL
jgi:hypothetical protein